MNKLPGFLFGIQAKKVGDDDDQMQSYVLQTPKNYTNHNVNVLHHREEVHVTSHQVERMQQLPGIRSLTCRCQYPSISVDYDIPGFPLKVKLQALTPLIPGNAKDSAWPLATFDFVVTNNSSDGTAIEVDVMQSALNFLGWDGHSSCCSNTVGYWKLNVNRPVVSNNDDTVNYAGWYLTKEDPTVDPEVVRGNLCLVGVTEDNNIDNTSNTNPKKNEEGKNRKKLGLLTSDDTVSEAQFWNAFVNRQFEDPKMAQPTPPSEREHTYIGGTVQTSVIEPNTTQKFRFVLTWYFPNRPCYALRSNVPTPIPVLGNRCAELVFGCNGRDEKISITSASRSK